MILRLLAGFVGGHLVVLEHSSALLGGGEITGVAAHEELLATGAASDATTAEAVLDEEHAHVSLDLLVVVLLLEGVHGALAIANLPGDRQKGGNARQPCNVVEFQT